MYNIFVESLNKLNLGDAKTEAIKTICNALLEANLSGDDSDTEYNGKSIDPGEFQVYQQQLDDGLTIIYKISETSGKKVFNFINVDGKIVSDIWFTAIVGCGPGYDGVYRVTNDDNYEHWNILRKDGTFLTQTWYDTICPNKYGLFNVSMDGRYNVMNMNGDLICNDWFKNVSFFNDGVARVTTDRWTFNYIDKNGEYLSENTFQVAHDFSHGVGLVSRGKGKYNYINTNGDLISDIDFDMGYDFDDNGLGRVETHIDRRKIDENGNISESTVDKMNLINEHGEYILDKWVDECALLSSGDYIGDYIIINNNQSAVVDCKGNILREWMDI